LLRELKAQVVARLRELVERLPKEERELVEECYWGGQTVEQVSARLGMTRVLGESPAVMGH
jgi:DNA-directed RNA polymerase specialized sigma24 family protein